MLVSSDLTVFNSFDRWLYNFGWIIYALVIMFIFSAVNFPDGKFGDNENPCEGIKNENVCGLLSVLTDARISFRYLS